MLDEPLLNRAFRGVTLFQVPVARQREMKIDMMANTRSPGPKMVEVYPFRATDMLERLNDAAKHCFIGFIHEVADGLAYQMKS
jgi:hypothetical protein